VAAEIEIEENRQQKQLPVKVHNLEQKVETLSAEIRALRARIEKLEHPMRPL
jgi:predicted  nucleic acid-binding Zn-ribbon protein